MTSLVDVIFNLLLFFVLSTSFSEVAGLPVELPSANAAVENTNPHDIVVVMTRDGEVIIEGDTVTSDALMERFRRFRSSPDAGAVVVQADAEVPHGKVVGVMDAAKQAGVARVVIAAQGN